MFTREQCLACDDVGNGKYSDIWLQLMHVNTEDAAKQFNQYRPTAVTANAQNDFDPLSIDASSSWNVQRESDQLRQLIMQDVTRTFPDFDYFRRPETHVLMTDILFAWCQSHNSVASSGDVYRQGMHELLAPIVFMLFNEGCSTLAETAYALFSVIMQRVTRWYFSSTAVKLQVASTAPADGVKLFAAKEVKQVGNELTDLFERVQEQYLRVLEPNVYRILILHQVEPQLYALRWVKLLFGREIPFDAIPVLWTAILADGDALHLVEWLAVALVINQRKDIEAAADDQTSLMQLLLGQRSVSNIRGWVARAVELRAQYSAKIEQEKLLAAIQPSLPRTTSRENLIANVKRTIVAPLLSTINGSVSPPSSSPARGPVTAPTRAVDSKANALAIDEQVLVLTGTNAKLEQLQKYLNLVDAASLDSLATIKQELVSVTEALQLVSARLHQKPVGRNPPAALVVLDQAKQNQVDKPMSMEQLKLEVETVPRRNTKSRISDLLS